MWGLHLEAASGSVTLLDIQADNVAVDKCIPSGGETTMRIGGTNITVNRCRILNGTTGLHLYQCKRVDIVDCIIAEHRKTGVLCTNLETDTQLVACELSGNRECGLATSYFRNYFTPSGPQLYRCHIHHNGIYGVRIVNETLYTNLTNCRIFDNAQTQVFLGAEAYLDDCDIIGGQIGIAITGGEAGTLRRCKIHDMPVGILASAPHEGWRDYTLILSSWIYNTTDAATRTAHGGVLRFSGCVVRDNTGAGVDIGRGTTQKAHECRFDRNSIGMLIRPGGVGEVTKSIVTRNGTGLYAQAESKVHAWDCHIEQHTGAGVVLAKDTTGNVGHCTLRSNVGGDIRRDAESDVYVIGDPQVDHLAQRSAEIPPK